MGCGCGGGWTPPQQQQNEPVQQQQGQTLAERMGWVSGAHWPDPKPPRSE